MNIIIGKNSSGSEERLDFTTNPFVLITGSTGGGKSEFINLIIHRVLDRDSQTKPTILYGDMKWVEGQRFVDVAKVHFSPEGVLEEMADLGKRDVKTPTFLIIDEFAQLMRDKPYTREFVETLKTLKEKKNIYVVISTSIGGGDVVTEELLKLFETRVAFPDVMRNSLFILGNDAAEKLEKSGECIFFDNGKQERLTIDYIPTVGPIKSINIRDFP